MKKIMLFAMLFSLCFSQASFAAITSVHFGTEATYPPFEFVNESGVIGGFDIDLANALCQQMKAQCTFSTQAFNSLIPSLQVGKFDALISAIGVTAEREKQIAFTNSYYAPSGSFVAPINKHYTLTDVDGKTIGVQAGTTFEKYLHDKYGSKVTVKPYASIQDAFLDLVSGRVDMVLSDNPISQTWLKQNDNAKQYAMIDKPIIDPTYFGSGYAIAVRKDNTALVQALNTALAEIKANGTYDKIVKKYF